MSNGIILSGVVSTYPLFSANDIYWLLTENSGFNLMKLLSCDVGGKLVIRKYPAKI